MSRSIEQRRPDDYKVNANLFCVIARRDDKMNGTWRWIDRLPAAAAAAAAAQCPRITTDPAGARQLEPAGDLLDPRACVRTSDQIPTKKFSAAKRAQSVHTGGSGV